ncbi:glycoside hydrolase family 88 protein [Cohnella sp. REN36]|nr:glycoside hydrolase family 88 protein [Cohnella sp. REN36]
MGWYTLALAEFLDLLPAGDPRREEPAQAQAELLGALLRYQDGESGLWYQVVDKGHLPDNWLETSCSSLFVYALCRAVAQGIAGEAERRAAAGATPA